MLRRLGLRGHPSLLATSFLTFIVVGAEQSLYGPAFETFQSRYGLDAATVSLSVSLHFLGSFVGIILSGLLIQIFRYRRFLAGSALLMTAGLAVVGLSGSWPVVLAGAFAAGLGFGFLDVGVNLLVVRSIAAPVNPVLNLLNAMFGLGAMLGPALVAATVPTAERAFLVIGAMGLAVMVLVLRVPEPAAVESTEPSRSGSFGRVFVFTLIYFLYVSSEVGAASWEASHLAPYFGVVRAAGLTSLYWGAITVGRLLAVPISAHVRPATMVVGSSALALVAALATNIVPVAPAAYAAMGLAFAPIFPSVLAWLHETYPRRAEQMAPIALAGATLGPVVTSPLIGLIVSSEGPQVVPHALSALVAALLLVSGALHLRGSGRHSGAPGAN
jgi:FHS family glucose/mannose:H+ symporter-like MFS transporter